MSVVFCILGCCISVSVPQTCMYNVLKKLTQEYVRISKLAHLLSGALTREFSPSMPFKTTLHLPVL